MKIKHCSVLQTLLQDLVAKTSLKERRTSNVSTFGNIPKTEVKRMKREPFWEPFMVCRGFLIKNTPPSTKIPPPPKKKKKTNWNPTSPNVQIFWAMT